MRWIFISFTVYPSNGCKNLIHFNIVLAAKKFSFHKRDDYHPLPPSLSLSCFIFRSFSLSAYGESLQKYTCCRHLRRCVSAVVPLIKPKEFESGNSPPLFLNHTQICLPLSHYLFQPVLKRWVTTVIDKLVKQNSTQWAVHPFVCCGSWVFVVCCDWVLMQSVLIMA